MSQLHPQTIRKPTGETFTFNMVEVKGGTFMMGLNGEDESEKPTHKVKLDSFLGAEYPVTQDLYEFVTGENPSRFLGKHRPVERVDWYDAIEFCNGLSEINGLESCYQIDKTIQDSKNENSIDDKKWLVKFISKADGYRLPSEAEWEYSARGGQLMDHSFDFSGSNELNKVGWYGENSYSETFPVGLKKINLLGLYDLSGNNWEWCWDWFEEYLDLKFQKANPVSSKKEKYRVVRGGSWDSYPSNCQVDFRHRAYPFTKVSYFGFRLFKSL